MFCVEVPDPPSRPKPLHPTKPFAEAWTIYRSDRAFRRAARVAMLFITSILLFPHYHWLGREQAGAGAGDLVVWVVVQNISVGILSVVLGSVADRFGNRLAIRLAVFATAFTPLVAWASVAGMLPQSWFWVTFVFLGLTPVTMKTILNYTLELCPVSDHPRYQSTMSLCFAVPFLLSPLVGLAIDWLPFSVPFAGVSALIAAGGVLTFWMSEPRNEF